MLVLSRKVGERIVIGDNITVQVVEVRGDKIRLGIVAPREIVVDREEVHAAKQSLKDTVPVRELQQHRQEEVKRSDSVLECSR